MPQQDALHSLQRTTADFDTRPYVEVTIRLRGHSCSQSISQCNDFRFRQNRGNAIE